MKLNVKHNKQEDVYLSLSELKIGDIAYPYYSMEDISDLSDSLEFTSNTDSTPIIMKTTKGILNLVYDAGTFWTKRELEGHIFVLLEDGDELIVKKGK